MASHSQNEPPYREDGYDHKASPVVTPTRVLSPTYSPATVLADSDLDGLSLYEKKCVLVNREIDAMGMGRYQWYIWGLCGFGYMLDLLWAQAFGLTLSPLQQELGFGNDESGNISTSFNAGLTAGAFFWGVMSDLVGRRWAFNLTCLFSSIFGLCLGASNNYTTFLVLTAFVGFGVGGNIPIDTTITLEFLPQNRRFLLATLSIFQPIGVVICSAIAFGFIPTMSCSPNFSEANPLPSCAANDLAPGAPCCGRSNNMGWRYLLFTLGGITLAVFCLRFFVFRFRESPKFLIYQGQDEEAIRVVQHIARTNGHECRLSLAAFEALKSGSSSFVGSGSSDDRPTSKKVMGGMERYRMLFSSVGMTRLTILVWLTYIMDFWGFTVAGFYLPRILALKNGSASQSLSFTYASYIYTYAPGILGVLAGAAMYRVPRLGRKWTMTISSALMGLSIILFSTVDTVAKNLGLFTMEYFFQSMFNAVLYGWTPEAFPAPVRGTACGVASFWGRLFGIVSPLIAQSLYGDGTAGDGNMNAVLYLAGGVTLGCVVSTALLPTKRLESSDGRS
ncbi:MFS general substrate transporter [Cryphonectria parasitica EP155]|uniref:MFS general substrate transporter n=1 Tax=Cryphonectria parasitica (strain ATCC 38755 / EP155) TaxID=660469 RepID=A0A9P5CJ98_CRYP1|nr:MFS general substrate transporter [Cryphonectria parasitica EP155]KAF3760893.1 MFS general substrate transporter [Cryphonectria parasitica EP155]